MSSVLACASCQPSGQIFSATPNSAFGQIFSFPTMPHPAHSTGGNWLSVPQPPEAVGKQKTRVNSFLWKLTGNYNRASPPPVPQLHTSNHRLPALCATECNGQTEENVPQIANHSQKPWGNYSICLEKIATNHWPRSKENMPQIEDRANKKVRNHTGIERHKDEVFW